MRKFTQVPDKESTGVTVPTVQERRSGEFAGATEADLDEAYALGQITYREMSERLGRLVPDSVIDRLLRYLLLSRSIP